MAATLWSKDRSGAIGLQLSEIVMIARLLTTTALLLVVTGAQVTPSSAAAMLASGYQMATNDALATKLLGSVVFSTVATKNGAAANANDANAQQIGVVRDLVVTPDGKVAAVVIGIGGFLGMAEKNVAVAYGDLHWTVATDGSTRASLDTTADALKAAPDFAYPAAKQAANTTAAPATAKAANAAPDVDVAKLTPSNMDTVKSDDLKGIDVLDPTGHKIASINDLVLTTDGKVDAIVVDFGGFLGIGTKQIALAYQGLKFMDDADKKHYLVVNVTKEQLDAQRAYNKDDYAANRAAERLTVAP